MQTLDVGHTKVSAWALTNSRKVAAPRLGLERAYDGSVQLKSWLLKTTRRTASLKIILRISSTLAPIAIPTPISRARRAGLEKPTVLNCLPRKKMQPCSGGE